MNDGPANKYLDTKLPITAKGNLAFDPRPMESWWFKDATRVQFGFQQLGLHLNRVDVRYVDEEGDTTRFTVDRDEWEDILQVLVHSLEHELCIEFGARLLGENERLLECF